MVRLVKGAYWDSEIKRAQVDGLEGFPVFTRKVHTDVSYLACARKLLAAPDAVFPQFATHNAHTVAAIHGMAGDDFHAGQYEFQCLHGMGEPLYEEVVGHNKLNRPAASTPRSARTRRCWPTWCAACWRTAPTPPSSTASRTRRCRWTSWRPTRWPLVRPTSRWARRTRASPCRATCSRRSRQLRRAGPQQRAALAALAASLRAAPRAWRAAPTRRRGGGRGGPQPRRPARRGRPCGEATPARWTPRWPRPRPRRAGRRRRPPRAPPACCAPPTCWRRACRRCSA